MLNRRLLTTRYMMAVISFSYAIGLLLHNDSVALGSEAAMPDDEGAPMSWFMLPENDSAGDYHGADDKGLDEPSPSFRRSVDTLFEAQGQSFDRLVDKSQPSPRPRRRWKLSQINADLAISAEGLIGVLALRGEAAIRTFWFKVDCDYMHTPTSETFGTRADSRQNADVAEAADDEAPPPPPPPSPRLAADEEEADASFDANMSDQELNAKLEQLAEAAHASGTVKDKQRMLDGLKDAVSEVSDMMSAVPETAGFAWQPFKFRFAVIVEASGQVLPFMTVGGDLRLRLDWKITPAITPEDAAALAPPRPMLGRGRRSAYSMRELVLALSNDLALVNRRHHSILPPRFRPSYIEIIVGIDAGGDVGIAQSSLGVRGHLYFASLPKHGLARPVPAFMPAPILKGDETINVIDEQPSPGRLAVHKRAQIKGQRVEIGRERTAGMLYQVNRASFRRGLAKSQKISAFFAERALKTKHKHWAMRQFRTDYELSITGGIGLATLSGHVAARVLYVDVN